jgi:aspartyl-tRNA synthetase
VFSEPVALGGSVKIVYVPGGGELPRKQIDSLVEFSKTYGAKGLAWAKIGQDGSFSSSYAKFLTDEENSEIQKRAGLQPGGLILIVADAKDDVVFASLGALRCECAKRLGLVPEGLYNFVWITEFPLFEYSEEEDRYVAKHHPFTSPMDSDIELLETDRAACRAKAYDLVLNGTELGGGSIRINTPELQEKMFGALGFSAEDANERFGHLINAFKFGAPPHGGIAFGLDRIIMHLAGLGSIRDVIAFPKVQNASELMTNCPDVVEQVQLEQLRIALAAQEPA